MQHLHLLIPALRSSSIRPEEEALRAALAARQHISDEDEQWLDHEANLVDEKAALDILAGAPNFAAGFEQLTGQQKQAIERLQDHISKSERSTEKKVGGKRKRMCDTSTSKDPFMCKYADCA